MEQNLQFRDLAGLQKIATDYSQQDNSYLFAHITPGPDNHFNVTPVPKRFNGLLFILVRRCTSEIEIEVNFEQYQIGDNMMVAIAPGTLFSINKVDWTAIDCSIIFLNFDFLHEININPAAIDLTPLRDKHSPVFTLAPSQTDLLSGYLRMFYRNSVVNTNPRLRINIASNLISALFYQLVQFLYESIERTETGPQVSRRSNYVNEFIKLVHVYYNRERSVAFYASRLFISPKYLSLLVKESIGKSAARVIDEFVILEAKNMLRFSGKNIQQVAYALNFSNQSSFGKYFKHLTGMSPTEYQRT